MANRIKVTLICFSCLVAGSVRLDTSGRPTTEEVLSRPQPDQPSLMSRFDEEIMTEGRVHLFLRCICSDPGYVNKEAREFYRPKAVHVLIHSGISTEHAEIYSEILTIESNYDPLAQSRAHALGFWQLMPATARQYGLRVTNLVDERLDFLRSTRAAARYLLHLERMFNGDPVKVLFAYNGGPHRVIRKMREHQTTDGFAIDFHKNETFNFAPKVLAMYLYHKGVKTDSTASFRALGQSRAGGATRIDENRQSVAPQHFSLSQNYPNRLDPTATFQFSIANSQLTILNVCEVLDREVAALINETKQPGNHEAKFDGTNLASGVYFCRLETGDFFQSRKLVLQK